MNLQFILRLALVLSGVLFGCSKEVPSPTPVKEQDSSPGKLYEIYVLKGRPSVEIYMKGFQDMAFDAYLKEGGTERLLFRSLACMTSQFESRTNTIVRENRARRVAAEDGSGPDMYSVFWSKDFQRLALVFAGNYVAAYDCKTGQKIQIRDGLDFKGQSRALGAAIESFLDGKEFTDADVEEIRKNSYPKQPQQSKP